MESSGFHATMSSPHFPKFRTSPLFLTLIGSGYGDMLAVKSSFLPRPVGAYPESSGKSIVMDVEVPPHLSGRNHFVSVWIDECAFHFE